MNKQEFKRFKELLAGEEGCNFNMEKENSLWICHGDYTFTKKILKKHFPKENVGEFIKYCKSKGGFCDCEIIFNVK